MFAFRTLWTYILRTQLLYFVGLTCVLTFSLSLERLLRLMDEATAHGIPLSQVLVLISYLMPHYLGLTLPAAFFLGTLIALRRLQDTSELVVMLNAGASYKQIIIPLQYLALLLCLIMLILTGYAQPQSRYSYRYEKSSFGQGLVTIHPGVFVRMKDLTMRAEQVTPGQEKLLNFFASIEQDGIHKIMVAREAIPIRDEAKGHSVFLLKEGNIIYEKGGEPNFHLSFEEHEWDVPYKELFEPYGERGQDEREMFLHELLWPNTEIDASGSEPLTPPNRSAEFHFRLVQSASVLLMVMLAMPLILLGRGRTGKAYGFIAAILLLIFYQKILGFAHAYAASGKAPAWLMLWPPFLLLGGVAYFLNKKLVPQE